MIKIFNKVDWVFLQKHIPAYLCICYTYTYKLVFTIYVVGFFSRNEIKISLIVFSGICVEALSNPQTVLTTHAVNGILKALSAVLTSEWPKQQIGVDPILSKEVLNVMHR